MATYLTENFTGTTGAVWSTSNWVSTINTTGATATIDGNRGRMGTGTSGSGRISRRFNSGATTYSNIEVTGKFELSSGNCFPSVWIRADSNIDSERGYSMKIDRFGTFAISRVPSGYSGVDVDTQSRTFTAGTVYSFRFRAIGGEIKARAWTGSEPSTWDLEYTDGSPLAANYVGLTVANGAAVNAYTWFDDIVITSGQETINPTGSIQPTGVLLRGTFVKNPFVGSITATGALIKLKVVAKLFTASVTAVGALTKKTIKTLTGSSTSIGTLIKVPAKRLSGSITPTGYFNKSFIRVFTGSITATGNAIIVFAGRVFGRPGIVRIVAEKAGEVRMRIRRG